MVPLPPAPEFVLHTAAGASAFGPLLELGEGWRVRLGGAKPVRSEANDLIELRRTGRSLPEMPAGEQLIFANGDRVPGTVERMAGERIQFRPQLAGNEEERTMAAPLSALAAIWLTAPDAAGPADVMRRRLLSDRRTRDVVHLRNGDVVEGILAGLDDSVVQVEVEKKLVEIKRERVAAVAFNTELSLPSRPKTAHARLVLAGGARLSLAMAACADGKTLTGTTLFGTAVSMPLDELAALYIQQGKAVYLSDLKPKQVEQTLYLDVRKPFVVDGSVDERDLRLAGSTYDKGLGVSSKSRLTYDLAGGGYRRLEALVGLDDRGGKSGNVRIRVLVDGKPHEPGAGRELTARQPPLAVRVDVTGAKELTLEADFGKGGSVGDHVNWVDARLVK